ncbi:MAG: DUF6728 family protein [Spirosomataceae bacterium]|jgi:hypothetical protein|nr:hypothetical protein [Bacteroidota bacterium]
MASWKEMVKVAPVFNYFSRVFKKDSSGKYPSSDNLRIMHGINKISIVMFLIAVLVMLYRAFLR